MKWINHFFNSRIPFYIYNLKKGDSIIYSKNINNDKSIIILHGIAYLSKIFTNQEIMTLAILEQDNIIRNQVKEQNCYYKIIAITETFLISFTWKDLIYNRLKINNNFLIQFINSYELTIKKYEIMNQILTHKYVKHRVIQLILRLSKDFGKIKKNYIIIPFHLSQITIAIITGTNRSTINKILNELCKTNIISYSYQKHIVIKDPFVLNYYNKIKNQLV